MANIFIRRAMHPTNTEKLLATTSNKQFRWMNSISMHKTMDFAINVAQARRQHKSSITQSFEID